MTHVVTWSSSRKHLLAKLVSNARALASRAPAASRAALDRAIVRVTNALPKDGDVQDPTADDVICRAVEQCAIDCAWLTVDAAAGDDITPDGRPDAAREIARAAQEFRSARAFVEDWRDHAGSDK